MKHPFFHPQQLEKECHRCLGCSGEPCTQACPLHVSPKTFIAFANQRHYAEAVTSIYDKNPLGLICGLVCPDKFCMKNCNRTKIDTALNIPSIQASLIQAHGRITKLPSAQNNTFKKIAVIGSGPAGIGAVWKLLRLGFCVELFEKDDKLGGSLNLIPQERLSSQAIEHDYNPFLTNEHFKIHLKTLISEPETLLKRGFSGVIMAVGTNKTNSLGIEGENYIVSYTDYLSHPQNYKSAQNVAIIGGGRVAADCALIAHRQGAKSVQMLIRRHLENMKMSDFEKKELLSYGVEIIPLTRVIKVQKNRDFFSTYLGQTKLIDGKCVDNPDISIKEKSYHLIIKAIGGNRLNIPDKSLIMYAGECKNGASTVVEAIASGVDAAIQLTRSLT